jgi:hypothetical protein
MTKVIQIEVNPSFGMCDCCNEIVDDMKNYVTKDTSTVPENEKLMKTFVDNSPTEDGSCIGAIWLCQECFALFWTDKDAFVKKMNECFT